MNIFALDENPVLAARYHTDRHAVKMIVEYCQILSTTHHLLDGKPVTKIGVGGKKKVHIINDNPILYKQTHQNHPSSVWARETYLHYTWLVSLTKALCKEYTHRYGKIHKCEATGMIQWFYDNTPKNINMDMTFRYPTPAMPDDAKVGDDVIASYRNYYNLYKTRMYNWKNSEIPPFVVMPTSEELENFKEKEDADIFV